MTSDSEPLRQLTKAGYLPYLLVYETTPWKVSGVADVGMLTALREDPRFLPGEGHWLHPDVGPAEDRDDFRGLMGKFGKGSLQIVFNCKNGCFYADVDRFNYAEDLYGGFGHTFIELLPNWIKRWLT